MVLDDCFAMDKLPEDSWGKETISNDVAIALKLLDVTSSTTMNLLAIVESNTWRLVMVALVSF